MANFLIVPLARIGTLAYKEIHLLVDATTKLRL